VRGDALGPMGEYLCLQLNRRLARHVHLQLMHEKTGAMRHVPDSLVAAVYLQFALEIAGGRTVGRPCANP
jgi:hypothetical protein